LQPTALIAEKCHQHIALFAGIDVALGMMHVLIVENWMITITLRVIPMASIS
jgi:hypothetical protein